MLVLTGRAVAFRHDTYYSQKLEREVSTHELLVAFDGGAITVDVPDRLVASMGGVAAAALGEFGAEVEAFVSPALVFANFQRVAGLRLEGARVASPSTGELFEVGTASKASGQNLDSVAS